MTVEVPRTSLLKQAIEGLKRRREQPTAAERRLINRLLGQIYKKSLTLTDQYGHHVQSAFSSRNELTVTFNEGEIPVNTIIEHRYPELRDMPGIVGRTVIIVEGARERLVVEKRQEWAYKGLPLVRGLIFEPSGIGFLRQTSLQDARAYMEVVEQVERQLTASKAA